MIYFDRDGVEIQDGDIIDIHQTVNGCNQFVVFLEYGLDIRYEYDVERRYEYNQEELLGIHEDNPMCLETEIEIVGNIKK